jgi:hypothetical protein
MSRVTNVMLSVMAADRVAAEEFSRWLDEDCPRFDPRTDWTGCGDLALITNENSRWGGRKYPECTVYAGTLNHAYVVAVVEQFGRMPWRKPHAVQLFLMTQEELFFRVWMIRDGEPRQYAPGSPLEDDDAFWGR